MSGLHVGQSMVGRETEAVLMVVETVVVVLGLVP